MTEQNSRYADAVTALNYSASGFNASAQSLILTVGEDAARGYQGLIPTASALGKPTGIGLSALSIGVAAASAPEGNVAREVINQSIDEAAVWVSTAFGTAVATPVGGVAANVTASIYFNKADLDWYGWATNDLGHVEKKFQNGDVIFTEAWNPRARELSLHMGDDSNGLTYSKITLGGDDQPIFITRFQEVGNIGQQQKFEIDMRTKQWKLTMEDGTPHTGNVGDTNIDPAAVAVISSMEAGVNAELVVRAGGEPVTIPDVSGNTVVNNGNINGVTEPDGSSDITFGKTQISNDFATRYTTFSREGTLIVKDNDTGNLFIQSQDPETGYMNMVSYNAVTGDKELHFADPANDGVITVISANDLTQLTPVQHAAYTAVEAAAIQARIESGQELSATNPDLPSDLSAVFGAGDATDELQNLADQGKSQAQDAEGNRDVSDPNKVEDLTDTVDGNSYQNQGTTIDTVVLTDAGRVNIIMNSGDAYFAAIA